MANAGPCVTHLIWGPTLPWPHHSPLGLSLSYKIKGGLVSSTWMGPVGLNSLGFRSFAGKSVESSVTPGLES